ncbi:hypothetical protein KIN20_007699 [Parelaphostrongylus tenuis]|uniref:Uncharacterized protein n=1 Tax=Parelaphostrongylus tenuis TaxID=148309 RepID=A0AAD5MVU4_PARTN|nr:hypothetical protein KIN20_007699 [Parelaphostrongylus tenuis]
MSDINIFFGVGDTQSTMKNFNPTVIVMRFHTGEWTECSASCGTGEQKRSVVCEGRDAKGRRERRPDEECSRDKPSAVQMCSLGPCGKPQLLTNRVFEQNASEKKLTLGIAHIKVSANGNLRIFHARMEDAGVYECYTNKLQGNVTLRFKYRDDDKPHRTSFAASSHIHKGSGKNISFFESILSSGSYAQVVKELQKHRGTLQARWEMGHWTDCKQSTCGVAGYQAREVTCSAIIDGVRRNADPRLCTALASARPPETRPCHKPECPRWEAGEWSECSKAPCVRNRVAKQRRDVRCLMVNGDVVDEKRCDRTQKPKSRKECENTARLFLLGCKAQSYVI